MGEAAYNEAKERGELIEQRLRETHDKWCTLFDDEIAECDCHDGASAKLKLEAADLIVWLSKERDSLIAESKRRPKLAFEEWDKANPPSLPFNLIVDLTMHGDCHAKPDPQLHEALVEVIDSVRRDAFASLVNTSKEGSK